ncbi:outer membrane protein assembly factor [Gracilimonas sp. Q87]|uniref:BamA/OMP85 family outer membrane protein n=1 Tax=Gracilimonas sp. Q87 TaxID=3384766 RepID=UPI0039842FBB
MHKAIQFFILLLGLLFYPMNMALAQDQDEEPVQPRVWSVDFKGNTTYEDLVLSKIILNEPPGRFKKLAFWRKPGMKLNENEVRRDVIRIERFYQRRGFDEVKVSYEIQSLNREWRKAILFTVTENKPIRIKEVNFDIKANPKDRELIVTNDRFNTIRERLPYRKGERYEVINEADVRANLTRALNNLGFPYANSSIEAETDSVAKSTVVNIEVTSGVRARFDTVTVEGEESLGARYIARETGIKDGEYFSNDQLREAQREVFSHHLLRFAIVSIPDQPQDSTISVNVRVKEAPLRTVQLLFGIGNLTRLDNGWADFYKLFRGRASWTHRNVRGKGERFTISSSASAIEQRLSTDYLFPYLFNTKSSFVTSPFISHQLEPSYEIFRGGFTNSFLYQYSSNLTGSVSYEFTLNNESTLSSQESLPDSIQSYNTSSFNLNGYYSTGLNRGRSGWSIQPFWQLSGLFSESTFSFQKVGLDTRKFTPLTENIVFAKRINLGAIYFSKNDTLPSNIRLFSGGTNSVRGWNRQELGPKRAILDADGNFDRYVPIGGRANFSFNTEFRFRFDSFIKGFGMAAFLDGGQVWRNFGDIASTSILFGTGAGLRYQSPIGPVRVDVAYKVNPTDKDLQLYQGIDYGNAWDRWGIHFSIGQAF